MGVQRSRMRLKAADGLGTRLVLNSSVVLVYGYMYLSVIVIMWNDLVI